MTDGEINNVYDIMPANAQAPKSMVILLHGLGSNGQDLISLAPMWATFVPETVFVSPDAPFVCDMVPPGYPNSYQWFSLQDRDPDKILAGVQNAAPILDAFIDEQLKKYDVSADKLVLCGFSQGTMMSLYAVPRYKEKVAGVLGYSGALIGGHELGNEAMHKAPVCLIHGEADDVVPIEAHHQAREVLQAQGYDLSGHTTPYLGHSIDQDGIDAGRDFLKSALL